MHEFGTRLKIKKKPFHCKKGFQVPRAKEFNRTLTVYVKMKQDICLELHFCCLRGFLDSQD